MGKILYFDCFSGISGDMSLGALLDLGIDFETFKAELAKLGLEGEYEVLDGRASVNGISAFDLTIKLNEHSHHHNNGNEHIHHHHSRNFADICYIIDSSALNKNVKDISKLIFKVLAEAEAKVHNKPVDEVHFHEVGAVDSIVDIVGTAICIDILKPDKVVFSPICEGTGFIKCQHGVIPVPVPATMEILRTSRIPFSITDEVGEMVTPTGAAIVAALADEFCGMPMSVPLLIGYGAGKRRFKRPNILRAVLLEVDNTSSGTVEVLECNIDDSTGEALGFAMDAVFSAGALDVFFTPIQMKKNRPAIMLTAICTADTIAAVEEAIFVNTSTLGVRRYSAKRTMLKRDMTNVQTGFGNIRVKVSEYNGHKRYMPEYEDVKAAALTKGVPFGVVYEAAVAVSASPSAK